MAAGVGHGLRGTLLLDEPMSRHTSWRVGGVAERFYHAVDIDDLAQFLSGLTAGEALFWVGLGSNLLVRDGGIKGAVICTSGALNRLELNSEQLVYVEAGVACPKLARFCARNQLTGAEFLAGIPGTVGGALAMNAGAFGGEIWPLVRSVETIDDTGTRRRRMPEDYRIAYRSVQGPQREWFVAAQIDLQRSSDSSAAVRIKEMLAKRAATQPMGEASCGSVFRNPPGDYAGRLIEACGLKGYCIGGACVSSKHANFIVTCGASATASDIEALIEFVAQAVFTQHGVRLKTEVCIVGHKLGERL